MQVITLDPLNRYGVTVLQITWDASRLGVRRCNRRFDYPDSFRTAKWEEPHPPEFKWTSATFFLVSYRWQT